MSIPNLPTDNLYKFLAIGGLFACVAMYWIANRTIVEANKESILVNAEYESKRAAYLDAYEAYMIDVLNLVNAFYDIEYIERDEHRNFMELSVKDMTKRSEDGYKAVHERFIEQFENMRLYQSYSLRDVFESTLKIKKNLKELKEGSKTVEREKVEAESALDQTTAAMQISERAYRIAEDEYLVSKSSVEASASSWELAHDLRYFASFIMPASFILAVIGFSFWWWRFQRYQDQLAAAQAKKAVSE